MTRTASYGSAAWRAWTHDHHWASVPPDPLGAGNSSLLGSLTAAGFTPIGFYDRRKNVTATTTVTAWDDCRGTSGFGPQLVGTGHAPAWDSTNQIISNPTNTVYLETAASALLDYSASGGMTLVYVGSVPSVASSYTLALTASGGTTRELAIIANTSTSHIDVHAQGNVTITGNVAPGATLRCIFAVQRANNNSLGMVANAAQMGPSTAGGVPVTGNNTLTLFGFGAGGSTNTGAQCMAILVLPGDVTAGGTAYTAIMNTIISWAVARHTAVTA